MSAGARPQALEERLICDTAWLRRRAFDQEVAQSLDRRLISTSHDQSDCAPGNGASPSNAAVWPPGDGRGLSNPAFSAIPNVCRLGRSPRSVRESQQWVGGEHSLRWKFRVAQRAPMGTNATVPH
jgi:hypothetical protein